MRSSLVHNAVISDSSVIRPKTMRLFVLWSSLASKGDGPNSSGSSFMDRSFQAPDACSAAIGAPSAMPRATSFSGAIEVVCKRGRQGLYMVRCRRRRHGLLPDHDRATIGLIDQDPSNRRSQRRAVNLRRIRQCIKQTGQADLESPPRIAAPHCPSVRRVQSGCPTQYCRVLAAGSARADL